MKKTDLGHKIKIARTECKLTQQQLAEKIGTSYPVVNSWENGKYIPKRDSLKKLSEALNKPISYFLEEEVDMKSIVPLVNENVIKLPILASIPAGLPEFSEKDVEFFWDVPRFLFHGADFMIHCNGDSMEPDIHKGDYCVIRKENEPLNGKAMLVKTEDGFTIKKIVKKGNTIELHPTNGNHKVIKPKELKIIGAVLGYWHRMGQ